MEAKELRIGNYVHHTDNWSYRQPKHDFKEFDFKWDDSDFHSILECTLNIEDIEPIKLDEDWFLKCKSNSIFNNGFEYKKTSTGRFEIYVGMSLITVIEFVHELQNLNFALLGEDVVFEND